MREEQIISMSGTVINTTGGRRVAIGNAGHKVGDWVWVDSGYVFGHKAAVQNVPYIPRVDGVYLEMFVDGNLNNLRSLSIKSSGKTTIKTGNGFGTIGEYGNFFAYDNKSFAIISYGSDGITVYICKDGIWSQGNFDGTAPLIAEMIDGDLYWSTAGYLASSRSIVKSYKNLSIIRTADNTSKTLELKNNFKTEIQNMITSYGYDYVVLNSEVDVSYNPYYPNIDLTINYLSCDILRYFFGVDENGVTVVSHFHIILNKYLFNNNIVYYSTFFDNNGITVIDDWENIDTIEFTYYIDSKYKILSNTGQTFYTLVDIVNNRTYDWTPYLSLLDNINGRYITISEITTDILYIYIQSASFLYTKSAGTMVKIDEYFYVDNTQLVKISSTTANRYINQIETKF